MSFANRLRWPFIFRPALLSWKSKKHVACRKDQTEPWRGFVIGTRIIDVGVLDRQRFDTYVASLTAST